MFKHSEKWLFLLRWLNTGQHIKTSISGTPVILLERASWTKSIFVTAWVCLISHNVNDSDTVKAPMVSSPFLRELPSLTICRCYYIVISRTFFSFKKSLIWVFVSPKFEQMTSRKVQCSTNYIQVYGWTNKINHLTTSQKPIVQTVVIWIVPQLWYFNHIPRRVIFLSLSLIAHWLF